MIRIIGKEVGLLVEYKISHLRKAIDKMRIELVQLSNNRKSYIDPDVIKLSQKLDRLLDEYQALTMPQPEKQVAQ